MKKTMALMIVMITAVTIFADTETIDGVTWNFTKNGGTATVTGATPCVGSLVMPETLGDATVTAVGDYAFKGKGEITSMTLPRGITSIGRSAFWECSRLSSVSGMGNVTQINDVVFALCPNLKSVDLSSRLVSIGNFCFANNSSLKDIGDISGVESFGYGAFYGCAIEAISLSSSLWQIDAGVFDKCKMLKRVTMPAGVKIVHGAWEANLPIVMMGQISREAEAPLFSGCSDELLITFLPTIEGGDLSCLDDIGFYRYRCQLKQQDIVNRLGPERFWGYAGGGAGGVSLGSVNLSIRPERPTAVDCSFSISNATEDVKVRALAFKDGRLDFSKVVRMETFLDSTGLLVENAIPAGTSYTLSWDAGSDMREDLAQFQIVIMTLNGNMLLPMEVMDIPSTVNHGPKRVSWNAFEDQDVFRALLWLYADHADGIVLNDGKLMKDGTVLVDGRTLVDKVACVQVILHYMGFSVLEGAELDYVRRITRLALFPSQLNQYAVKDLDD